MSVDQTLVTDQPIKVATETTITPAGGLVAQTEAALAKYPLLLIQGFGIVLLVLLAVFVYLLVCAVSFESATAQHYLVQIFTAWGVWLIVAGVIVGGAYALPQKSPFQA